MIDATAVLVGLGAASLVVGAVVAWALQRRMSDPSRRIRSHPLVGHYLVSNGQQRRITGVHGATVTYEAPFEPVCQKCGGPSGALRGEWCARCISNMAGGPS